ncbi:MAG: hypothetical protein ACLQA5_12690 [Solirubrobacteraceae bacterium]
MPDVVRLDHELDPLLAGLAERVLGLADVLLGQRVDVLVGPFGGGGRRPPNLDVVVGVAGLVDERGAMFANVPLLLWTHMTTAPSEPLSQRLTAIREQLKLLADYL